MSQTWTATAMSVVLRGVVKFPRPQALSTTLGGGPLSHSDHGGTRSSSDPGGGAHSLQQYELAMFGAPDGRCLDKPAHIERTCAMSDPHTPRAVPEVCRCEAHDALQND